MAGVCNIGYSTRLLKKSSAIERSNKGSFRSESILALSVQSQIGALELDLPPTPDRRALLAHTLITSLTYSVTIYAHTEHFLTSDRGGGQLAMMWGTTSSTNGSNTRGEPGRARRTALSHLRA